MFAPEGIRLTKPSGDYMGFNTALQSRPKLRPARTFFGLWRLAVGVLVVKLPILLQGPLATLQDDRQRGIKEEGLSN